MKRGFDSLTRSSVRRRWCGVTSAVIEMPRALAQRTTSSEPAVDTWQTCNRASSASASSASRAMMDSSATEGHPVSPRRSARAPAFICEPTVSEGSWACCATTAPTCRAARSASRISAESETQCPSSENTRGAASDPAIPAMSASSSPRRPRVTAPTGRTSVYPAWRPQSHTCWTASGESVVGWVFAIA